MSRKIAFVLAGAGHQEQAGTALKLAERLLSRGHRVSVFAHEGATALSAGSSETATVVAALLRRGVHGGTLDWVIDAEAARREGNATAQAPGVVPGDASDLWAFVREADVVLSVGSGH